MKRRYEHKYFYLFINLLFFLNSCTYKQQMDLDSYLMDKRLKTDEKIRANQAMRDEKKLYKYSEESPIQIDWDSTFVKHMVVSAKAVAIMSMPNYRSNP